MLDTDPDQIHLWLTFLDEIRDEKLLRRYRGLLAPEEQRRLGRFVFTIDQTRYLVTRALVRTVLSRYVAIEPQDWSFAENVFGRPEIANDDDRARRIAFNISHSNSLILLGVTGNKVLGVDVENYYARKAPLDIADSLFAPEELAGLRALPDAQQCERFFEYWTLKEAYIKARGIGLSLPLRQISFRFPGDKTICVSMDPQLDDHHSGWRFWQFRLGTGYVAAVCARRSELARRLIIKKVIPLAEEQPFDFSGLRSSSRGNAIYGSPACYQAEISRR